MTRTKQARATTVSIILFCVLGGLLLFLFAAQRIEISAVTISAQPERGVYVILRQNIFGDSNLYLSQGKQIAFITKILSFDRDERLLEIRWDEARGAYVLKISRSYGERTEELILSFSGELSASSSPHGG